MKNTIEILERMNEWRRYDGLMLDGPEMPCPKEFGLAIDDAVLKLKAADAVADELADYKSQYACGCAHDKCSRCAMQKSAHDALCAYFK